MVTRIIKRTANYLGLTYLRMQLHKEPPTYTQMDTLTHLQIQVQVGKIVEVFH